MKLLFHKSMCNPFSLWLGKWDFFFLNFLSIFYLNEREKKKPKFWKEKRNTNIRVVKKKERKEKKEESPKTLHITIIFLDFGDFAVERVLKLPTTVEKKTSSYASAS